MAQNTTLKTFYVRIRSLNTGIFTLFARKTYCFISSCDNIDNIVTSLLHTSRFFLGKQKCFVYIIVSSWQPLFIFYFFMYSLLRLIVLSLSTGERLHLWKQIVFSSSMYQRQTSSSGSLRKRLLSTRSSFQDSGQGSLLSSMHARSPYHVEKRSVHHCASKPTENSKS